MEMYPLVGRCDGASRMLLFMKDAIRVWRES